jgi:hypothetical protein
VLSLYDKTDLAALKGTIFALNLVMKASSENVIFRIEGLPFHSLSNLPLDETIHFGFFGQQP